MSKPFLPEIDRIWLVGASTGIGFSLCKALSQAGKTVIASARSADKLEKLATECASPCYSMPLDISDSDEVAHISNVVSEQYQSVDMLIVNAGTCEYIDGPNIDLDSVKRVMDTNFWGAITLIEHALPLLREAVKQGRQAKLVVMLSSVAYQALPRAHAYGSSKAALRYFTECLKIDLQQEGIGVQIISPGFVKTPLTDLNDFPMPFMIDTEEATRRILDGLQKNTFDIHFPKRFTYPLKALSLLPAKLRFALLEKLSRPQDVATTDSEPKDIQKEHSL